MADLTTVITLMPF